MNRTTLTLPLAAALLLIPTAASAHEATASMGCLESVSVLQVDAIKYDESEPNRIRIVIDGTEVVDTTFGSEYHRSITRSGYVAHEAVVTITAEGEYSPTFELSSPACKDRDVIAPRASFIGPCEDPMYAARFDNRRSTRAVTFSFRYIDAGIRRIHRLRVAAGQRRRTPFVHVDGLTVMRVKANGILIASERSAPGGMYAACPR
jgi:hypothetical protein